MDMDDVFGDMGGEKRAAFGPREGVAGILLGASACDGHIADEEVQSLMGCLMRMKLYERATEREFGKMMESLVALLKRGGPEKLVEKCAPCVPSELAETVFANACNIVLADGVVEDEEKEFLSTIMGQLDIAPDRAKKIIQIMVIKNKG
jgi:tellurite resistance protein